MFFTQHCQKFSAVLAEPSTMDNYLDFLNGVTSLTKTSSKDTFWTGLVYNPWTKEIISLANQTQIDFSHWSSNQPSSLEGPCIAVNNSNLRWMTRNCTNVGLTLCTAGHFFICSLLTILFLMS